MPRSEFSKPTKREALKRSTSTPEYRAWINMKSRCNTPSSSHYEEYGGRGIRVCIEWETSFPAFLAAMGARPTADHSLDRIDTNGNYEPGNCRWATRKEQQRNLRTNRIVVTQDRGEETLAEAAERSGAKYNTVLYRLKRGWSLQQALSLAPQRGRRP